MKHLITAEVLARADQIQQDFQSAQPFRHACIEAFLEPAWAETLLQEFPVFDPKLALNEFGKVGRKAVKTDIRNISDRYREFYDYIRSQPFLDAMSAMTGIPGLKFDPEMYGGGTHENLEGQALDAHVDFNYDQGRKLHRRINLLVYLNKEWEVGWGGAIQLHSDPRDWDHDQVKTFNSSFNRCVVFETNEHSWHGFRRIQLPEAKRGLTRKCISIYLYTEERPADEIVPEHGTFYVQNPPPEWFTAGHTLTDEDVRELSKLFGDRDNWIQYYQRLESDLRRENAPLHTHLASLKAGQNLFRFLPRALALRLGARLRRQSAATQARQESRRETAPAEPGYTDLLVVGRKLSDADVNRGRQLLMQRDQRIKEQQQLELRLRGERGVLETRIAGLLASLPLPLAGLRQVPGSVRGAYTDGWVSSDFALRCSGSATGLKVSGWLPATHPAGFSIEARVDGTPAGNITPTPGQAFEWRLEPKQALGREFTLELKSQMPAKTATGSDQRDLAFILTRISAG